MEVRIISRDQRWAHRFAEDGLYNYSTLDLFRKTWEDAILVEVHDSTGCLLQFPCRTFDDAEQLAKFGFSPAHDHVNTLVRPEWYAPNFESMCDTLRSLANFTAFPFRIAFDYLHVEASPEVYAGLGGRLSPIPRILPAIDLEDHIKGKTSKSRGKWRKHARGISENLGWRYSDAPVRPSHRRHYPLLLDFLTRWHEGSGDIDYVDFAWKQIEIGGLCGQVILWEVLDSSGDCVAIDIWSVINPALYERVWHALVITEKLSTLRATHFFSYGTALHLAKVAPSASLSLGPEFPEEYDGEDGQPHYKSLWATDETQQALFIESAPINWGSDDDEDSEEDSDNG